MAGGVEFIQNNFTSGVLDVNLHAREDLTRYQSGLSDALNTVILPFGGLKRRDGLAKIDFTPPNTQMKLLPFIFNTEQKYLLVFRNGEIDILKDGFLQVTIDSPYNSTEIFEIDNAQTGDNMIICHQNHPPKQLQRQGSDVDWLLIDVAFSPAPYFYFDFPTISPDYVNDGLAQTILLNKGQIVLNNVTTSSEVSLLGINHSYYEVVADFDDEQDISRLNYDDGGIFTLIGTQELAWSASKGYPLSCTFFENRLWFAGSTQLPTHVWASKSYGYFDFNNVYGADTDSLVDTVESQEFNKIVKIFSGRSLQVFTTGAEFVNTATPITPSNTSFKKQTGYGSTQNLKPIFIDGSTLFVDSTNKVVRQFLFGESEQGWTSTSISLMSTSILNNIQRIDAIKGTENNVGDYVYCINGDGTLALLNTLRKEEILGWTNWDTLGSFLDVSVVSKDVYFVVLRNGKRFIELLTSGTYSDHNVHVVGTEPTDDNIINGGDNVIFGVDNVIYTDNTTGTLFSEIQTNFDSVFSSTEFKVVNELNIELDKTYIGTGGDNVVELDAASYNAEVGLNFNTSIVTLPLATSTKSGTTLHRRKRVIKVDMNVLNTLGLYLQDVQVSDKMFPIIFDSPATPFTGFKERYLLGYNRLYELKISQENPLPMTLRAITYEVGY